MSLHIPSLPLEQTRLVFGVVRTFQSSIHVVYKCVRIGDVFLVSIKEIRTILSLAFKLLGRSCACMSGTRDLRFDCVCFSLVAIRCVSLEPDVTHVHLASAQKLVAVASVRVSRWKPYAENRD